jgi:uncharacterized protein YecE (DUF72 family)
MEIHIGCCGFPVSRKRYFETFSVVELQQTFYQPPEPSTVMRWHKEAPQGFEYTLKAWQLITHEPKSPTYRRLRRAIPESKKKNYGSFKPTDEVLEAWKRTEEVAEMLGTKIIVFQSPASFEPTNENMLNMKRFFSMIKRGRFILAWEPRGNWSGKDIEALCRELELIHVVDPFIAEPVYGEIKYYRLHGIGGYRYKYTRKDMIKLKGLADKEVKTYFMFNNVYMFEDARLFKSLLEEYKDHRQKFE